MLRRGSRGGDGVVLEGMVFCNEYDEGMETSVRCVGDIPTFFGKHGCYWKQIHE